MIKINKTVGEINKKMMSSFIACTVVLVLLLVFSGVGIFGFNDQLIKVIKFVGIPLTLLPIIMIALKFPDNFVKYFMAISMSCLIGILGCYHDIGIYITFVLVPIASCMYFDGKFTAFCTAFSYIVMVFAVYKNSAGKFETLYQGLTQFETFRGYILGFTLEYVVIIAAMYQIMKRVRDTLEEQHQAYLKKQAQDAKYQLLVKETNDIVFEYFPDTDQITANRTLFEENRDQHDTSEPTPVSKLAEIYPNMQVLHDHIKNGIDNNSFEDIELDFTHDRNGVSVPLWYSCECFLVHDKGVVVSVIGKLHDITRVKMLQKANESRRLSEIYMDDRRRNSLYGQIMKESTNFTDADYALMASGHQFLAGLIENAKYDNDPIASLMGMLASLGQYFNMDRICVIETDMASGTNSMNYQWVRNESDRLENYFTSMTQEEIEQTKRIYDTYGYIEYNPEVGIVSNENSDLSVREKAIISVNLGNQIWLPTISEGEYSGAVYFDRYNTTPYTATEKFLLVESVNTIHDKVKKINAEKANRAKSDFLSTMSHEIRTPMNAILGMTEVTLREEMSPAVRKNIKMVQSSANGLLTLINDILDYSKIESGKFEIVPEKFSLLSIINDLKEIVDARNKGKLEIILEIPEDLPTTVFADAVRIKQVMINFCTNAIKYTDKGHVKIGVSIKKTDDNHGTFKFRVEDTGIGIKKSDLSKLFKSYTQVDTSVNHHKEGTGLGLAISKQLVELMNGGASVSSEYGKGSEFSFYVPLEVIDWTPAGKLEDYEYAPVEESEDEKPVFAPDAKVLLVDDTEINLLVAEALMSPTQMQIEKANSGKLALELMENNTYDLVFMDHFMPEMDGVETTKHIRELQGNPNQNVPIVALTADAMAGVKEELLASGMNDFLSKPIIMTDVYQVLKRWLPAEKIKTEA